MEQVPLIKGFTRIQQVFYAMEHHTVGAYTSLYISKYISENFYIPNKTFEQVRAEVCSVISALYNKQANRERNFIRYADPDYNGNVYLYEYLENQRVNLPVGSIIYSKPKIVPNVEPKQHEILKTTEEPTITKTGQLCMSIFVEELENSLKLDSTEIIEEPEIEEPIMQEDDLPPLMQDIRNAEMLSEYNDDKLQYHLEQLISLLPPNCPEISFKKNAYDKLYSFTLTQEA
jgi:hypothetical protein